PPKWTGRCPECGEWGSVVESPAAAATSSGPAVAALPPVEPARPIGSYSVAPARARLTGIGELDRVLGGGLVPGAVVLLAGEPGVGKSTLLLDVAQQWAAGAGRAASGDRDGADGPGAGSGGDPGPALVISAEES